MKFFLACVGIVLISSLPTFGQTFSGYPSIKNFTPQEYGGNVQNWRFAEDSSGILYMSNAQVVKKYDGVNWHTIELPNSRTFSVHEADDGKIYVGGLDEFGYLDVSQDSSKAIEQYYSLRHLLPDSIQLGRFFEIESAGNEVYFQTNHILIRYDGESVDYFQPKVRFGSLYKKDGAVFVREALEGLKEVKEDSLELIPGGDYFADMNLFTYIEHPVKDIFCTYRNCTEYKDGAFIPIDMEAEEYFSEHYIDEAIVLRDESLLFATRLGGLVHTDASGNIINIINEEAGLVSNTVYGVYEDRHGSVWVATINGISRIDFSLPLRYYDERTSIDEAIFSIGIYQDEFVFGSSSSVYHFSGKTLANKHTLGGNCTDFIEIDAGFFSSCGDVLHYFNGREYTDVEITGAYKVALYEEPNMVVFGSSLGFKVGTLSSQGFQLMYTIDDLSLIPTSLMVDEEKNIWVGSKMGIYQVVLEWNNGQVLGHRTKQFFADVHNPNDDKRTYVTQLGGKPTFLTWGRGIQEYDFTEQQPSQNTRLGSFFSDTSKQYFLAAEDNSGNVWFRSGGDYQGALKTSQGNYDLYEGPLKLIDHNQNNTIYAGSSDYVWYGTEKGAVRYTKDHSFDHDFAYHTQINEVLVRNDSLINGGNKKSQNILKYADNELRFTYAAASYFVPEETIYRVKLEGFDQEWGVWTTETQKDYTNIPEGDYSFVIQARNVFGVTSESDVFRFTVLPPWYRTWWAYLLYTIIVAGILYLAYKIRVNQLLRVERIRNSIASDLHDEVSATLSSISYFAKAIESDKVKGDKNRFVKLIANSAGDAKEKITDIVWAINPEHDDWTGFLSKCRRYASDLLESKNIKYSLKIQEHIPGKLDMQLRQHMWLIFKEMLTNAARHSEAKNIDIIITYKEGFFNLVLQDDGKGMDVDGVKKGNGLVNINKRADQIGAEINLKTSEGFGTRWKLKVKV